MVSGTLTILCSTELSEMAASSNKILLHLTRNQVSPSVSSCPKAGVFVLMFPPASVRGCLVRCFRLWIIWAKYPDEVGLSAWTLLSKRVIKMRLHRGDLAQFRNFNVGNSFIKSLENRTLFELIAPGFPLDRSGILLNPFCCASFRDYFHFMGIGSKPLVNKNLKRPRFPDPFGRFVDATGRPNFRLQLLRLKYLFGFRLTYDSFKFVECLGSPDRPFPWICAERPFAGADVGLGLCHRAFEGQGSLYNF